VRHFKGLMFREWSHGDILSIPNFREANSGLSGIFAQWKDVT